MGTLASQITSLTIVYSTVYLGADKKKYPRHWPLWGAFTVDTENVSIWWRHHVGKSIIKSMIDQFNRMENSCSLC